MLIFITGRPGIGKSTVCMKVINLLKKSNFKIGGVICPEARVKGRRVGFKIIDLLTLREGWLAHVDFKTGIRIGKYHVNLNDLNGIGVNAILNAIKEADVIVIDEIGPMELKSYLFREAIYKSFKCGKPVIAVLHWRLGKSFLRGLRVSSYEVYEVTFNNRNYLHETIFRSIMKYFSGKIR